MISAALIGLGKIGFEYDYNKSTPTYSLTHFTALGESKIFNLKYVVDKDIFSKTDVKTLCNSLGITYYKNVKSIPKSVDALIISVPVTEFSRVLLEYLEHFECKLVIGEKLGMIDDRTLHQLLRISSQKQIKIFINYYRRALPETKTLFSEIQFDDLKVINCVYTGRPENTLPHFIDLISYLLKERPKDFRRIGDDFTCRFAQTKSNFIALKNVPYDHYTLEIFGKNSYCTYSMDGLPISICYPGADKLFNGHQILNTKKFIQRNSEKSMSYYYDEVYKAITVGSDQVTTIYDEIENLKEFRKLIRG